MAIVALLYTLFYNYTFFKYLVDVFEFRGINIVYDISVAINLFLFIFFCFTVLASKYTTKPFLIFTVMVSSFTTYFMNTYNIVIDDLMYQNVLQTNINESIDLFSFKLILYVLFLGVLPSIFIYRYKITYHSFKKELKNRLKIILIVLLLVGSTVLSFSGFYTSFFRGHKDLKYYANPTFWVYSVVRYYRKNYFSEDIVLKAMGEDAKIVEGDGVKKELIVLVVGEATRADHFSLNGYDRETNPLLAQEDIINFSQMSSCGTTTAVSVPCMFSIYGRGEYDYKKGISTENLLDVLGHTNDVSILWRDNNSDSKGVALRVEYQDYKEPHLNPVCDDECRDEGMIVGLDKYIEKNKDKDIFIVLHQMGNHGPSYYKRYTKEFERFTPVCQTNQVEECSDEELRNAYDNALLHTDSFLKDVIDFLKPYSNDYATAMVYMSDHGESLGENNLYLHGIPYFIAPDAQTHVASLVWFGDEMKKELDMVKIESLKDKPFSQDNLFHTILGLFEVDTKVYDEKLDMFGR
ncbi:MAG: phosphoethanolamine--lipid A transferase [Campylobacterales bacterium]|nr:phosphoethanolamine--lipid A transferase [Campylobacterales bacterium]